MNKLLVLVGIMLLVTSASGLTLEVVFGQGIVHNASSIDASVGAPQVGTKYYFTSTGVSNTAGDAFVVSDVNANGTIDYERYAKTGDCQWHAIVDGTVVEETSFNGTSVSTGATVKWSATPNSSTVEGCRLEMDYNVS